MIQQDHREKIEAGPGGCLLWVGYVVKGYGVVRFGGKVRKAHRVAYEERHGAIPAGYFVDHICHQTRCVNVDHLRLATPSQNSRNRRGAVRGARSGIRGVTLNTRTGRWRATVWVEGKHRHLGYYDSSEAAGLAAESFRAEQFGAFAGGSR